jgi:hypothetical protein
MELMIEVHPWPTITSSAPSKALIVRSKRKFSETTQHVPGAPSLLSCSAISLGVCRFAGILSGPSHAARRKIRRYRPILSAFLARPMTIARRPQPEGA